MEERLGGGDPEGSKGLPRSRLKLMQPPENIKKNQKRTFEKGRGHKIFCINPMTLIDIFNK